MAAEERGIAVARIEPLRMQEVAQTVGRLDVVAGRLPLVDGARPHRGLVGHVVPDGVAVLHDDEGVQGRRLAEAVGRPAEVEPAARLGGEVAVARTVDERLRAPGLPPALRLRDDGRDVLPRRVAPGRDDRRVERHAHAALQAHVLADEFHVLGLVDPVLVEPVRIVRHARRAGTVNRPRAIGVEPLHDLAVCRALVEVEDVGEKPRRPHAAQAPPQFEETHLLSRARGGDGGGDARRTTPAHDHVRPVVHGKLPARLGEARPARGRSATRRRARPRRERSTKECSARHLHVLLLAFRRKRRLVYHEIHAVLHPRGANLSTRPRTKMTTTSSGRT